MALKLIPPGGRRGKPNRFYLVRGTINGRRVEISTATSDQAAARRAFRDIERDLILASEPGGERGVVAFAQAARLYLAWRRPGKVDEKFVERLIKDLGDYLLTDITSAVLVAAAERIHPGAANETRNRQVFTPAAAVLHYAASNGICPHVRIRKLPEKKPEARAIDPSMAEVAISAAQSDLKILLTWLFRMGTRITETLAVQREWIDRKTGTVRLYDRKRKEWMVLPVHRDVLALLPAKMEFGPLFPWRTRGGAYKPWRKLLKGLGMAFTPHQARHTFATTLVNMGLNLDPLPHWRDPKSRARYGRPNIELQRSIMDHLGAGGRGKKRRRS
jgi:integrase